MVLSVHRLDEARERFGVCAFGQHAWVEVDLVARLDDRKRADHINNTPSSTKFDICVKKIKNMQLNN